MLILILALFCVHTMVNGEVTYIVFLNLSLLSFITLGSKVALIFFDVKSLCNLQIFSILCAKSNIFFFKYMMFESRHTKTNHSLD